MEIVIFIIQLATLVVLVGYFRKLAEYFRNIATEISDVKKKMHTEANEKTEVITPQKRERGRKAPRVTELQFRIDWIKMRIVFSAFITSEISKRIKEPRISVIQTGGRLFFVFSKYERYNLTGYTAYQYAASCTQVKEVMREYLGIETDVKMTYCAVTGITWNETNTEARLPISKKINLNRR